MVSFVIYSLYVVQQSLYWEYKHIRILPSAMFFNVFNFIYFWRYHFNDLHYCSDETRILYNKLYLKRFSNHEYIWYISYFLQFIYIFQNYLTKWPYWLSLVFLFGLYLIVNIHVNKEHGKLLLLKFRGWRVNLLEKKNYNIPIFMSAM